MATFDSTTLATIDNNHFLDLRLDLVLHAYHTIVPHPCNFEDHILLHGIACNTAGYFTTAYNIFTIRQASENITHE